MSDAFTDYEEESYVVVPDWVDDINLDERRAGTVISTVAGDGTYVMSDTVINLQKLR